MIVTFEEGVGKSMGHVFYRSNKTYPVAVRGHGVYLWDETGKRYLDGSSGALVANVGHGHPHVVRALQEQATRLTFVHGSQFSSDIYERYADRLTNLLPEPGYRFWAVSGGSEAIESAIKLARQYHVERGDPGRFRIVTRRPSYHGASLGALAASGMGARRELYLPLLQQDAFVQMTSPAENGYGADTPQALEALLLEVGAETVAAFVAEPIVGAADAARVPGAGYYSEIQRICRRYGVLFIADEVMCGMGRAGSMFAVTQWAEAKWSGVPDLIVLGKGLAAGYAPLAGVLASPNVYATVMEGSGTFKHGFTYAGHPVSLAAGNAVLDILEWETLVPRAREAGERLLEELRDLQQAFPSILEVRGRGFMLGLVLGDPRTGVAFERPGLAERLGRCAFDLGLVTYPGSGALDGVRGDHLLLGPPLTSSDAELDELLQLLRDAFKQVEAPVHA